LKIGDTFVFHGKPVTVVETRQRDIANYDYQVEFEGGGRGFVLATGILDDLKDYQQKLDRLEKFERMLPLIKKWEADPSHFNRMRWVEVMVELEGK
jgi:hypothetical protein